MAEARQTDSSKQPTSVPVKPVPAPAGTERITQVFQGSGIDPRGLNQRTILTLQRTAGNRAVNELLRRRTLGESAFPPREIEARAPNRPTNPVAAPVQRIPFGGLKPVVKDTYTASMWHDTVEEPLVAAREELAKGPAHYSDVQTTMGDVLDPIKAVEATLGAHPFAHQQITLFRQAVALLEDDLSNLQALSIGSEGTAYSLREAKDLAAEIAPDLGIAAPSQAGDGAASPSPASALWKSQVMDKLERWAREISEAGDGGKAMKWESKDLLPQLDSVETVVRNLTDDPHNTPLLSAKLATLSLKLKGVVTLMMADAGQKVKVSDVSDQMLGAARRATAIGTALKDGTLDQADQPGSDSSAPPRVAGAPPPHEA